MAITIGSNIASLRSQRTLAKTSTELASVFERLSSGQRINRASDDPAGLAIADSLKALSSIHKQGTRNLNDGISLLSIADAAVEQLSGIVSRLEELAAQAANGVYSLEQRRSLDAEAQALSDEFFRITKATEFNGRSLLNGDTQKVSLQAGIGPHAVIEASIGGALGDGTFTSPLSFAISDGNSNRNIALGDFNGDGNLDVVTANYSSDTVHVFLGQGNGSFAADVSYAAANMAGLRGNKMTLGDMNNDGHLDIVTAGWTGFNAINFGIGNGTFEAAVTVATPATGSRDVQVADLNGDGLLDIISSSYLTDTVGVNLGTGEGNFTAGLSYGVDEGIGYNQTRVADVNGDGLQDVVVTAYGGGDALVVYLGKGDGTLGARSTYSVGGTIQEFELLDIDGDGKKDIVGADSRNDTLAVMRGNGDGTFVAATTYSGTGFNAYYLTTGDFNGDGATDVAISNYSGSEQFAVFLGNGNGTFQEAEFYFGGHGDIAAGDVNRDGVLDLVSVDTNPFFNVSLAKTTDGVAPLLEFSLETISDARKALGIFEDKREQLSLQRGTIGASQARIDIAANVLEATAENFTAAESRIRDADIALESSELVRLQILQEAGAAILAQASQQPALALQLLR